MDDFGNSFNMQTIVNTWDQWIISMSMYGGSFDDALTSHLYPV